MTPPLMAAATIPLKQRHVARHNRSTMHGLVSIPFRSLKNQDQMSTLITTS
jgi:hypothetical protein